MQDIGVDAAQRLLRSYLDDIARMDLPRLEGHERRDPVMVRRALGSLARHSATEVTYSTIAIDVGSEERPARVETVSEYVSLLERIFVIEQQPSWGPHLRSRDRIRKRPKLHFTDPALAVAGIGGSPQSLLRDLNTFGLLFESLAVRDMRIYGQHADADVSHYRDSSGIEVDAIVATADRRWIAAEVKLSPDRVDDAAESLLRFREKLDVARTPLPSALIVLTTGSYAYQRPDGVTVVPLAMLGP